MINWILRRNYNKQLVRNIKFAKGQIKDTNQTMQKMQEFIQEYEYVKQQQQQQRADFMKRFTKQFKSFNPFQMYKSTKKIIVFQFAPEEFVPLSKIMQKFINSREFSKKQCYYIVKMLNNTEYILDQKQDDNFLKNLKKVLKQNTCKNIQFASLLQLKKETFSDLININQLQMFCLQLCKGINKFHNQSKIKDFYKKLIYNGMINKIWSQQMQKNNFYLQYFKNNNYFHEMIEFHKGTIHNLKIIKNLNRNTIISNTQNKISKILSKLSYNFQNNLFIWGREVDFLINDYIILEYNGYFHYCINNFNKLNPRQQYRIEKFRKMGFTVILIPPRKWQMIEYNTQQYQYLVKLIETQIAQKLIGLDKKQ